MSDGNRLTPQSEQPYSLRERVSRLEGIVGGVLKGLGEGEIKASSSLLTPEEDTRDRWLTCPSTDSVSMLTSIAAKLPDPVPDRAAREATAELESSDQEAGTAPILQLFDNDLVTRKRTEANDDKFIGSKDMSPKAQKVRNALLSLIPPQQDVAFILKVSATWWSAWEKRFPEICNESRHNLCAGKGLSETAMAPAEVAKMLVLLSTIVGHIRFGRGDSDLRLSFDPQEFSTRCFSEVERLIVYDDHFAATLPGIECQAILAKHHQDEGRPRKAWMINRRAIEFAQLAGMHLSTSKPPRPGDTLFDRRLRIWCQLGAHDRFLSLILGLPYAMSDVSFIPQVEMSLRAAGSATDRNVLQLGIMAGKIIDRNQNPDQPCLPSTLQLEQDLEDIAKQTPEHWWDPYAYRNGVEEGHHARIMTQLTYYMLRVMVHLPFMLKSSADSKFQYCHDAAVESARYGLERYKILQKEAKPYLCRIANFFAFMMAMVLAIHLCGSSMGSGSRNKEQDKSDWDVVHEAAGLLRQAGTENGGAIAAESAKTLGEICKCHADGNHNRVWRQTCKITVPYFGTVTVGPGKKAPGNRNARSSHSPDRPYSNASEDAQLPTPPMQNPEGPRMSQDTRRSDSAIPRACDPVESWTQANMPTVDLEVNAFQGFLDDLGEELWPNLDMDLGLDQGWNVDWLGEI